MFLMIVVITYKPAVKHEEPSGALITRLLSPDEFLAHRAPLPSPPQRSFPPVKSIPSMPAQKKVAPHPETAEGGLSEETVPSTNLPPSAPSAPPSAPSQEGTGGVESDNLTQEPLKPHYLPREKLFDRNIIGNLAKRESEKEMRESEEKGKKGKSLTLDTKNYKFLIYNKRLKERIENIWIYPHEEASRGIYGDLIIRFTIKKNGTLGAVELMRTSGHQNLDTAAMKALKDGEPYWPLPDEWGMDAYTIVGHFVYTIYGYYLR